MARDEREPQSYGSGPDWTTGKTGQNVNEQAGVPQPQHADFYDDRRESEDNAPAQGGRVSESHRDAAPPESSGFEEEAPVTKVTLAEGGARRTSFFKRRDYEE